VYLAGAYFWVPAFGNGMVAFELEVKDLQPPWDVVSQGHRVRQDTGEQGRTTVWSCPDPTEEVYLEAGPWHEYAETACLVDARGFCARTIQVSPVAQGLRVTDASMRTE